MHNFFKECGCSMSHHRFHSRHFNPYHNKDWVEFRLQTVSLLSIEGSYACVRVECALLFADEGKKCLIIVTFNLIHALQCFAVIMVIGVAVRGFVVHEATRQKLTFFHL